MFFLVSVIDSGLKRPLFASGFFSPVWCNSSGHYISALEEAGIKMATDQELGAYKAYASGAEETAVKKSHAAQSSESSL